MSTAESQIAQSEVPRPQGWNDECYEQFVELVTFARQLEEFGGSEALVSLFSRSEVTEAAVDKDLTTWIHGTGVNAAIKSTGIGPIKTRIVFDVTTGDGHQAHFSIPTILANLVRKPMDIKGDLGFNDWSALKDGMNHITIHSKVSPLNVKNILRAEFKSSFTIQVPGLSLKGSFKWDA